ncbi:hypothetical protein [Vogesella indigofera]|uniref:hypothetical protein n=1 Tax=Vogesella indigofera TaxID=45465 RepID=UPI00234E543A|nr:hypothetical protein [Vogesella indigofera]MDC7699863.1 hypothetical protein [Vogesella indigofera]
MTVTAVSECGANRTFAAAELVHDLRRLISMERCRVENGHGLLVGIRVNVAGAAIFILSRLSARDHEHVLRRRQSG